MEIDCNKDIIMQHKYGVSVQNHYKGIQLGGEVYTDVEFCFTMVAEAVGEVIGITHLIDFEQTNEINI